MRLFYETMKVTCSNLTNVLLNKNSVVHICILFYFYSFQFVKIFAKPLWSHDSVYMYVLVCFFVCMQAEAARDSKQSPMVQRNSSFATSHEVWKYINELGISKVKAEGHDLSQRRFTRLVGVLATHLLFVCHAGRWTFPWTTSRLYSTRSSTTARWR